MRAALVGQGRFSRFGSKSIQRAVAFAGAYLVEKCRTRASVPLYMLSLLPVSIPGMVLGLAYIFTFNVSGSPLNRLYGTLAILVISNLIHYFTVPFLTATTSLKRTTGSPRSRASISTASTRSRCRGATSSARSPWASVRR